ncbi:MAG: HesA/MoeB/ThiF family protein [Bacteroidales bacterium]|nr:HesA/MoeB/ThiF family protein [Bacteroidales bacterium]
MESTNKYQRYHRQTVLKKFGTAAQDKLFQAKVLVVGAGGLGCPALQYLAAAGVGTIGIIDFDVIELTNLQRQTLFNIEDIGKPKAEIAARKLNSFNPDIQFPVYNVKLEPKNALEIIENYDLVIDGSDNFPTRYLVNDACLLLNKPLVYGTVLRFEGQLGVFNLTDIETGSLTNYRDIFPKPPLPSSVLSCDQAGVLGVLPGIIGTMQAAEAIKIITGIGKPLCNKIVSYNLLSNLFYEFSISAAKEINATFPKTKSEFLNFDYEWFCGAAQESNEITIDEFDALRKKETITIIDIREKGELPVLDEVSFTQIPWSRFEEAVSTFSKKNKMVIFCQSGILSLTAVKLLLEKFPTCQAYSLKGGVEALKKYHHKSSQTSPINSG